MIWRVFITFLILLLLVKEGIIQNVMQFIIWVIIGFVLALLEFDEERKMLLKKSDTEADAE